MAFTTAQVNAWYEAVQFRLGPTSAVSSYVSLLNSGSLTAAQVQTAVINDTYTFANANSVIRIYQGAFNRVPDAGGQNYWTDIMGATPDAQKAAQLQTIATQFSNSTEFLAVYGVNGSAPINAAVLTAFYQNILQRAPDTAGFAYWLNSGQNVAQVLNAFSQSNEFIVSSGTPTTGFQQAQIANTAATSGPLWQYGGGTSEVFVLTTNADVVNSAVQNLIIEGVTANAAAGSTLQLIDTINPTGSNVTMNLNMSGTAMAMSTANIPVLNGVQTLNLSNQTGATSLNATATPALTTFKTSAVLGAVSTTTITNAITAMANYSFSNLNIAASDIAVTNATGVTTPTVNLTLNNVFVTAGNTAANSADFIYTGGGGSRGPTTLNINSTSDSALGVLTVLGNNAANQETLSTINISGAGKLKVFGIAGARAGDTSGFKNAIGTINASTNTGGVDIGVGTDTLTFTGGSANDALRFAAAGDLTSADTINMGGGTNAIWLADTNLGNSGNQLNAVVNAITTAQIIGMGAAATYDMSGITATNVSLGAGVNSVIQKISATDTIWVQGVTTGTANFTAALGFNTVNLKMVGDTFAVAAMGTLNVTNQSSINIDSAGEGAGANTIGAITNSANAVFTITGANDLTVTSLSAAASYNASAATGKQIITGANAASILTGGSNDDTITGSTAAGGDTIVGGAGSDAITLAVRTGTVADVITGGLAADTLAVGATGAAITSAITYNATAAESYATTGQFDTVTFANGVAATATGVALTVNTGILTASLAATTTAAFQIGVTAVTAGGLLVVNASGSAAAANAPLTLYQDSNNNGVIDTTDLRINFAVGDTDTLGVALVGNKAVITDLYVGA